MHSCIVQTTISPFLNYLFFTPEVFVPQLPTICSSEQKYYMLKSHTDLR